MEPEFDFTQTNAFISASELVTGMCLREGDMQKLNYPIYISILKEEYIRMNLSTIKQTKRILTKVNKMLNCINVPSDYLIFHSIGIVNEHGKFAPLVVNSQITTDIVDVHTSDSCGCNCGCHNAYCSNVKNYETIQSEVTMNLPDGTPKVFKSYIRKKLLKDGTLVTEISEPVKKYVNNVHTATVIEVSEEFAAQLEIKECGCIADTDANMHKINSTCDATDFAYESGCCRHIGHEDFNFYKIGDIGNRIHFPPHFPHDTVLLRYFADTKTKDLKIPILVARLMRAAVKLEQTKWAKGDTAKWKLEVYDARIELAGNLAKLKLIDFYTHVLGRFDVL